MEFEDIDAEATPVAGTGACSGRYLRLKRPDGYEVRSVWRAKSDRGRRSCLGYQSKKYAVGTTIASGLICGLRNTQLACRLLLG